MQKNNYLNLIFILTQIYLLFSDIKTISKYYQQMKQYKTKNTFTQKPSAAQITAYILFLLQVITFYVIIQARYTLQTVRIIMIVLYSASILMQFITTLLCSIIDPSDTFMVQCCNDRESTINEDISNMLYCDLCGSYVKLSTRHCKMCQRCVEGFDHHCIWINNCVGQLNYRAFMVMLSFTFLSMLLYLIAVGLLWRQTRWENYIGEMITIWCISLITLIFQILITNLIIFHIYLVCKNLTTYDYITKVREEQRNKTIQQQKKVDDINKTQQKLKDEKQQIAVQLQQIQQIVQDKRQKNLPADQKYKNSVVVPITANQIGNSQKTLVKQNTNLVKYQSEIMFDKKSIYSSDRCNEDDEISSEKSSNLKLSRFFIRNKSLKVLVNNDAVVPLKYSEQIKFKGQTCQKQGRNNKQVTKNKPVQTKTKTDEI